MKKLILLILIVFTSDFVNAEWKFVNYQPDAVTMNDVSILNEKFAIAVGEYGCVRTTVNGGTSWNFYTIDGNRNLISVSCVDQQTAFAVSNEGKIYRSTNSGKNWVEQDLWDINQIRNVKFKPNGCGIILCKDTGVLKSTDGGKSWLTLNTQIYDTWNDVAVISNDTILLAGKKGNIIKTTNGGETWEKLNLGESINIMRIQFTTNQHYVVLSDSLKTATTADGGKTWRISALVANFKKTFIRPTIVSFFVYSEQESIVKVYDSYTCAPNYYEFISKDDCRTWSAKNLSSGQVKFEEDGSYLMNVKMLNKDFGFGMGLSEMKFVKIDSTGFYKYSPISSYSGIMFQTIAAYDENHFVAVCSSPENELWFSNDRGETWEKEYFNFPKDTTSGEINDVLYFSQDVLLFVMNHYNIYENGSKTTWLPRGNIRRTADRGESFSLYLNSEEHFFESVTMRDKNFGILSSWDSSAKYTTDGGICWQEIYPAEHPGMNIWADSPEPGVFFLKRSYNSLAYLLRTYDNGNTWTRIDNPMFGRTFRIKFFDKLSGLAIGRLDSIYINGVRNYRNFIAKTDDGGETWFYKHFTELKLRPTFMYDFQFADRLNGIAVGRPCVLLRTTDGGETWIDEKPTFLGEDVPIIKVVYPTKETAIAVTYNEIMIKFSNRELDVTESQSHVNELNVYPNPSSDFIDITKPSEGSISIFNVFGETVVKSSEILNNSQFSIHNSQLRIDVSGLPSGVYFVRIGDKVRKFVKL